MLSTRQLTITVGDKLICKDLDWSIQPGETWGLLGVNGCGKTTLLHTLAGLRTPDAGDVLLGDQRMDDLPRQQVAQTLSLLFQDHQDNFPGSVFEAALTGRHPHLHAWQFETAQDHAIVNAALERVELTTLAERDVLTLSGGERQRLAIATQMVQAADINLLDEPHNHLDPHQQIRLMNSITEHAGNQHNSLCMSLHNINLAQRYCSHIALMFETGEILTGPAGEMLSEERLTRAYQHPMRRIEQDDCVAWLPE